MRRVVRSSLQSVLKLMNSVIGLVGMGMILYALWMFRQWFKDAHHLQSSPPWFIYAFLVLGIVLCFIMCSGHIAAETANSHCLSCYMVCVLLLIMLELAITTDIFLNRHWEEDFPPDPSGKFDELKNFVRTNSEMCGWIGLSIVLAQIISIILATVLRTLGQDPTRIDYDSDDDVLPARLPLLRNQSQQVPYLPESSSSVRIAN